MNRVEFNYLLIPWATATFGFAWWLGHWGVIGGAVVLLVAWLLVDWEV